MLFLIVQHSLLGLSAIDTFRSDILHIICHVQISAVLLNTKGHLGVVIISMFIMIAPILNWKNTRMDRSIQHALFLTFLNF